MSLLMLEKVSHEFVRGRTRVCVLQDIDLTVEHGDFLTIVGPSGCGKSTLLGLIAGTIQASKGRVEFEGKPIMGTDPERGIMLQQAALFPWLTAIENVSFGLRMKGVPKAKRMRESAEFLQHMGLGAALERYPYELSGGMKQRVALARTLINDPKLVVMDEPLGALDAFTKRRMHELFMKVWQETGKTFIMVTHDVEEAVKLGTSMVVMSANPGRVIDRIQLRSRAGDSLNGQQSESAIVGKVFDLLNHEAAE